MNERNSLTSHIFRQRLANSGTTKEANNSVFALHHHVSSSYVEGWRVMALYASRSSAFLLTSLWSFNNVHCLASSNHILLGLPFALLPLIFHSSITNAFLSLLPLNTCPTYTDFCCTIFLENFCSFSPNIFRTSVFRALSFQLIFSIHCSKTLILFIRFLFSVQLSQPYFAPVIALANSKPFISMYSTYNYRLTVFIVLEQLSNVDWETLNFSCHNACSLPVSCHQSRHGICPVYTQWTGSETGCGDSSPNALS